jgi:5-methylcytosine-specific restriction endonuclease McrA
MSRGRASGTDTIDHREHPERESLPDGVFAFMREVTLSHRRPLHRVSLPSTKSQRSVRRSTPPSAPRARTAERNAGPQKRAIKRAAMRDCGRRCVYCAALLDYEIATLDHVHPLAHGGATAPGNLVAACARCNRLKGDMLPTEFFMRYPWAGMNFIHYARAVHRALKRCARRAVSLAYANAA